MIRLFIPIALLALIVSCKSNEERQPFDPPEGYKSRSGAVIYKKKCAICHGDDGKKGVGGAKDLTLSTMDSAAIVNILENGKNGMPQQIQHFKSDEEVENMVEYLKSMRK